MNKKFTSYICAKFTFLRSIFTIKLFKLASANFFVRKNIITLVLCFFVALIIRLGFKQIDIIFIHNDSLFNMCTALSLCLSSFIKNYMQLLELDWLKLPLININTSGNISLLKSNLVSFLSKFLYGYNKLPVGGMVDDKILGESKLNQTINCMDGNPVNAGNAAIKPFADSDKLEVEYVNNKANLVCCRDSSGHLPVLEAGELKYDNIQQIMDTYITIKAKVTSWKTTVWYSLQVKNHIIEKDLINESSAWEIKDKKYHDYAGKFAQAFNKSRTPELQEINRFNLNMKEFYDVLSVKEQGLAGKIQRGNEKMAEIKQHLSHIANWDASVRNRENVVTKYLADREIG